MMHRVRLSELAAMVRQVVPHWWWPSAQTTDRWLVPVRLRLSCSGGLSDLVVEWCSAARGSGIRSWLNPQRRMKDLNIHFELLVRRRENQIWPPSGATTVVLCVRPTSPSRAFRESHQQADKKQSYYNMKFFKIAMVLEVFSLRCGETLASVSSLLLGGRRRSVQLPAHKTGIGDPGTI